MMAQPVSMTHLLRIAGAAVPSAAIISQIKQQRRHVRCRNEMCVAATPCTLQDMIANHLHPFHVEVLALLDQPESLKASSVGIGVGPDRRTRLDVHVFVIQDDDDSAVGSLGCSPAGDIFAKQVVGTIKRACFG